ERERIRSRMKMVIGQLEGILQELKEVAKELREIDLLTSSFDLEPEPDAWTPATGSSTSSSDKVGVPFELGPLDFPTSDVLSDSWEFCSFLEPPSPPEPGGDAPDPSRPLRHPLMNGGVPIANGPQGGGTPDSSNEETLGQKIPPPRAPGSRERVRFSDKVLYHALCCDDDDDDDGSPGGEGPEEPNKKGLVGPPSKHPATSGGVGGTGGPPGRRLTRNSSTQTVADKSTQT
ncbi:UPF0583 protein C15orf59, partial [Chaetura pelagica]